MGNHEFDEGGEELLRLLNGGQRTGPDALKRDADGQLVNTSSPGFEGADFPYLAANTLDRDGRPLLAPFRIVERAGARVGFIGVTTPSTPKFVLPRHAEPLPVHRHLGRREPLGAGAAAARRGGHRRARPRRGAGPDGTGGPAPSAERS